MLSLAALAAACGGIFGRRPALRSLTIHLSPVQTEAILLRLRAFAREHGFQYATGAIHSRTGTTYTFELRRNDMWIEGLNLAKDTPSYLPDGQVPSMEIDPTRFAVMFVRGWVVPTEAVLGEMVAAFSSALESIEGVKVEEVEGGVY